MTKTTPGHQGARPQKPAWSGYVLWSPDGRTVEELSCCAMTWHVQPGAWTQHEADAALRAFVQHLMHAAAKDAGVEMITLGRAKVGMQVHVRRREQEDLPQPKWPWEWRITDHR